MSLLRKYGALDFIASGQGRLLMGDTGAAEFVVSFDIGRLPDRAPIIRVQSADPLLRQRAFLERSFEFQGVTAAGDQARASQLTWLDAEPSRSSPVDAATEVMFFATEVSLGGSSSSSDSPKTAVVPILNCCIESPEFTNLPITAEFAPVENFKAVVDQIENIGRIAQTHTLSLTATGEIDALLDELDLIETALSFATGSLVTHDDVKVYESGNQIEWRMRHSFTRARARLPSELRVVQPDRLMGAVRSSGGQEYARRLMHGVVEACNSDIFIEARALNAIGIVESILGSRLKQNTGGLHHPDFRKEIRKTVMDVATAVINEHILVDTERKALTSRVNQRLNYVTDPTFREVLFESLDLDADFEPGTPSIEVVCRWIADTRNCLVHQFRFVDDENRETWDQYVLLLWAALCLGARELGYPDKIRFPRHLAARMTPA